MRNSVVFVSAIFLLGAAVGFFIGHSPLASASGQATPINPSEIPFVVSIDEVAQDFVFAERFTGRYEKSLTMSDGSVRDIVLTPVRKDGRLWVRFDDGEGHTYMGPNGVSQNGKLLVSLGVDDESWRPRSP